MIDHEMQYARHSTCWWNIKVLCGWLLILLVCERFLLAQLQLYLPADPFYGQLLVALGGCSFTYHYMLNRKRNSTITSPDRLLRVGGLYRYIRHPMYASDVIMYAGFVLLAPHPLALGVFVLSCVALYRQSAEEDRFLAQRFADEHAKWRQSTGLMFPRLKALRR